jgi:glucan biosynthesis protein C
MGRPGQRRSIRDTRSEPTFQQGKDGQHWQALAYALWESLLCLGMCIGPVYLFRRYRNRQGRLARFLSPNAYTAYLIHGVVITVLAYAVREVALYPLPK